jgi:hypothetical protein
MLLPPSSCDALLLLFKVSGTTTKPLVQLLQFLMVFLNGSISRLISNASKSLCTVEEMMTVKGEMPLWLVCCQSQLQPLPLPFCNTVSSNSN